MPLSSNDGEFDIVNKGERKASYHWSWVTDTDKTLDVILVRTSMTAELVTYELDFILRGQGFPFVGLAFLHI